MFSLVTPGITALEYAQRRSRLANKLPKGAIAVLAASEVKYRAQGIFNEYRQDSNFFYLTGRFAPSGRVTWDDKLKGHATQGSMNRMLWRSSATTALATITSSIYTFVKRTQGPSSGTVRVPVPRRPWTSSMRTRCEKQLYDRMEHFADCRNRQETSKGLVISSQISSRERQRSTRTSPHSTMHDQV